MIRENLDVEFMFVSKTLKFYVCVYLIFHTLMFVGEMERS